MGNLRQWRQVENKLGLCASRHCADEQEVEKFIKYSSQRAAPLILPAQGIYFFINSPSSLVIFYQYFILTVLGSKKLCSGSKEVEIESLSARSNFFNAHFSLQAGVKNTHFLF
jgi:hypothetical protein